MTAKIQHTASLGFIIDRARSLQEGIGNTPYQTKLQEHLKHICFLIEMLAGAMNEEKNT